ncbi:MAG: S-layer homology domain-containing protein [Eubacteriales bacterium]|nr:S-layer homology domain-containing protein [Eubacteriales bacterium]
MFTLLYNILRIVEKLSKGDSGKTLSDFADVGQIKAWAKVVMELVVKTGIVSGSYGILNPAGITTRVQIAQVPFNRRTTIRHGRAGKLQNSVDNAEVDCQGKSAFSLLYGKIVCKLKTVFILTF